MGKEDTGRIAGGGALAESCLEVEAGLFRKPGLTTLVVQNCPPDPRLFRCPDQQGAARPSRVETMSTPGLINSSDPEWPVAKDMAG